MVLGGGRTPPCPATAFFLRHDRPIGRPRSPTFAPVATGYRLAYGFAKQALAVGPWANLWHPAEPCSRLAERKRKRLAFRLAVPRRLMSFVVPKFAAAAWRVDGGVASALCMCVLNVSFPAAAAFRFPAASYYSL